MWYVDDVNISHKRKTVVLDILKQLENKLKVKLEATYGDTNDYLGTEIKFLKNKRVAVGM